MTAPADEDQHRRWRLRLGALLFRLEYYMQRADDIAAAIYRYDDHTYVQAHDEHVVLVSGDYCELLSYPQAIERCKEALAGQPLHRPTA